MYEETINLLKFQGVEFEEGLTFGEIGEIIHRIISVL